MTRNCLSRAASRTKSGDKSLHAKGGRTLHGRRVCRQTNGMKPRVARSDGPRIPPPSMSPEYPAHAVCRANDSTPLANAPAILHRTSNCDPCAIHPQSLASGIASLALRAVWSNTTSPQLRRHVGGQSLANTVDAQNPTSQRDWRKCGSETKLLLSFQAIKVECPLPCGPIAPRRTRRRGSGRNYDGRRPGRSLTIPATCVGIVVDKWRGLIWDILVDRWR